jgi:hypothetical protein
MKEQKAVKKSVLERGYEKDEAGDIYECGASERKDEFGRVVTHQDNKSMPDNSIYRPKKDRW